MITKTILDDLLSECEGSLRRCGRTLFIVKSPPASRAELAIAEKQLGVFLPPSLTNVLTMYNGLTLESPAANEETFSGALQVPSIEELTLWSLRLHQSLRDYYENVGKSGEPPLYLVGGLHLNEEIMLRTTANNIAAPSEAPAYLRDVWKADGRWRMVASTFEDWLCRSLRYIAEDHQSFEYFDYS